MRMGGSQRDVRVSVVTLVTSKDALNVEEQEHLVVLPKIVGFLDLHIDT